MYMYINKERDEAEVWSGNFFFKKKNIDNIIVNNPWLGLGLIIFISYDKNFKLFMAEDAIKK